MGLLLLALLPSIVNAQIDQLTGSGVAVVRSDGLTGVTATVRPTGGGSLQVLGTDGKTVRAVLESGGGPPGRSLTSLAAGMNVNDVTGQMIMHVGTISDNGTEVGTPGIIMWDGQNHARLRMGLDADGNSTIRLLDAVGNVVWSAP